jgi:hypothetical protein
VQGVVKCTTSTRFSLGYPHFITFMPSRCGLGTYCQLLAYAILHQTVFIILSSRLTSLWLRNVPKPSLHSLKKVGRNSHNGAHLQSSQSDRASQELCQTARTIV